MPFISVPPYKLTSATGEVLLRTPSCRLPVGNIIAVTGPSGAGKSLFIKSLFGWTAEHLEPVLTTAGGACLMIQDPSRGLTPGLNLAGHFKETASGADWRQATLEILRELGLTGENLLARYPESFSGGERQRIMLALVLVRDPEILVCDEPAASLDTENEILLWSLLSKMEKKRTLIFITHRLELIEEHANHVLLLKRGELVFEGSKQSFFREPGSDLHRNLIQLYREGAATRDTETEQARPALLSIERVNLSFGDRVLFKDFSWEIKEADWWWLVGPSGTGKTTLGRLLVGLTTPDRGDLLMGGQALDWPIDRRELHRRRSVQYIFQHGSRALNPMITIRKQLERAFGNDKARMESYRTELKMDHLDLNRLPQAFSLGEIQRLNLIRALAPRPKLVICDEIFGSLDLTLKTAMLRFLEHRCRNDGLAVVVITHNRDLVRWRPGKTLRLGNPIQQ